MTSTDEKYELLKKIKENKFIFQTGNKGNIYMYKNNKLHIFYFFSNKWNDVSDNDFITVMTDINILKDIEIKTFFNIVKKNLKSEINELRDPSRFKLANKLEAKLNKIEKEEL